MSLFVTDSRQESEASMEIENSLHKKSGAIYLKLL